MRSGYRVISSIELISSGNKRSGEGRDLYLQKRQDMIRGGVNTIEIDLLRGGNSLLPMHPDRYPRRMRQGTSPGPGDQPTLGALPSIACPSANLCR